MVHSIVTKNNKACGGYIGTRTAEMVVPWSNTFAEIERANNYQGFKRNFIKGKAAWGGLDEIGNVYGEPTVTLREDILK